MRYCRRGMWIGQLILEAYYIFPKKDDLGITENNRTTLNNIVTKIYFTLLLNRSRENPLEKLEQLSKVRSTTSQILTSVELSKDYIQNPEAALLFEYFSKALKSIHSVKEATIRLRYSLPKETIIARGILYKNRKTVFRPPDGDTDFYQHRHCCLARTYNSTIYFYSLHRLRRTNVNRYNRRWFHTHTK